jgi:hypothetical protein
MARLTNTDDDWLDDGILSSRLSCSTHGQTFCLTFLYQHNDRVHFGQRISVIITFRYLHGSHEFVHLEVLLSLIYEVPTHDGEITRAAVNVKAIKDYYIEIKALVSHHGSLYIDDIRFFHKPCNEVLSHVFPSGTPLTTMRRENQDSTDTTLSTDSCHPQGPANCTFDDLHDSRCGWHKHPDFYSFDFPYSMYWHLYQPDPNSKNQSGQNNPRGLAEEP